MQRTVVVPREADTINTQLALTSVSVEKKKKIASNWLAFQFGAYIYGVLVLSLYTSNLNII